jgi:NAD(P)-dependent dehydrogenase (short-subunit alcohol dehydrogenase family)
VNLRRTLDTVLDRAVVPGYTKIGYWVRRTGWAPDDPRPGSLAGQRALVTGASSGLGQAAAEGLARLGATVHLLVRDEAKGRRVLEELRADLPDADLHLEVCDVSDLADVRRFADDLTARVDRLDVLVHNAGALPPERTEAPGGHELTVALHVLGPLLMTELLLPVLRGHDARVVLVTSGGMYTQKLPVRDPDYERGEYRGTVAYARSKRMQVALAPLMQQRWSSAGLRVHVMHPGWADTPGVASSLPVFRTVTGPLLRDAVQGADTVVWLAATEPRPEGGRLWMDRAERPAHYRAKTRESAAEREQMWAWVLDAAGLDR